jgi:hypothetical protein
LKRIAVDGSSDEADLMSAARCLRSAALELRLAAPRTASVALLLSDAIAFTPASEETNKAPLQFGLRLLMEPFVPSAEEERLFDRLLDGGWEVTNAFDAADYSALGVLDA